MGPRLLQGDAVIATFCLLSRQNTEPTSKLELLALAMTKPFRCLPQHHTLTCGFLASLTAPWRTRGLLAMLIASRRTFGLESNLRAPLRTSGLEMIFPGSIILLTHLPSHLVNLFPKQRLPPFPRRLTPRTRRRLLIMVNRSGARPTVRSRRLLKKAFEATFSIFDGALAST